MASEVGSQGPTYGGGGAAGGSGAGGAGAGAGAAACWWVVVKLPGLSFFWATEAPSALLTELTGPGEPSTA